MTPEQVLREYKKYVRPVLETARDMYLAKTYSEYNNKDQKQKHICVALNEVQARTLADGVIYTQVVLALQRIVSTRLDGSPTLEAWLRDFLKRPGPTSGMSNCAIFKQLQVTRVAWINSLIKEFG